MNSKDLRNLSDEELLHKVTSLREELFNFEFRLVTQQLENPIRIRRTRRDIARALTVLRERELAGAAGPAARG